MNERMNYECRHRSAIALALMIVPAIAADGVEQGPGMPAINLVFVDDQALGLPPQL